MTDFEFLGHIGRWRTADRIVAEIDAAEDMLSKIGLRREGQDAPVDDDTLRWGLQAKLAYLRSQFAAL